MPDVTTAPRRIAVFAAVLLFLVLVAVGLGPFWKNANDTIRFVLGTASALLIILRPKRADQEDGMVAEELQPTDKAYDKARDKVSSTHALTNPHTHKRSLIIAPAAIGTLLTIMGIVTGIGLLHWMGGLLLVFACLGWALSGESVRDIALGLFVAFWIYPPVGQFELAMQWLSVNGAEWLLHCFNVRVWADEFVLRTALHSFGVPQACSGMRTATTVFLASLGMGILLRLRWYHLAGLVVFAVAQVLALNILRISGMVALAPKMSAGWSEDFLHDSLAVFLIIALVITQYEVRYVRRVYARHLHRRKVAAEGGPSDDKGSIYLPVLQRLMDWKVVIILLLLAAIGAAGAIYKRRPYHRSEMISGIVRDLAVKDLEVADRAAAAALELNPDNNGVRTTRVRVLLARRHNDEALAELEQVPPEEWTPTHTVFKALVLMQVGSHEKAIALVDAMPPASRSLPGVAMVRAEFAAASGDVQGVADNVATATRWDLVIPRVRALFGFLAQGGRWEKIVECYSRAPHVNVGHALLDLHAHMKMGELVRAGRILREALESWPDDARLLTYLATLASALPGSEWEKTFEMRLKSSLPALTADQLVMYIESSFRLKRPDLAWLAYRRLGEVDSTHPILYLAPVRFGEEWFTFRKHWSGIASPSEFDTVDFGSSTSAVAMVIREIAPLGREISGADREAVREKYLKRCLEEIEKREKSGRGAPAMWMTYLVAEQLARMSDKDVDWQQGYETLRESARLARGPRSIIGLIQVNTLMQLDLSSYGFLVADRTRQAFPKSHEVSRLSAGISSIYGAPEEALFTLARSGLKEESLFVLDLLYRTERFVEAERLARRMELGALRKTPSRQAVLMPRAELAVKPEWAAPLSSKEMAAQSKRYVKHMFGTSPFISKLQMLKSQWYRNEGAQASSDPAKWSAAGRDRTEKGIALTELALLLARQQRFEEAGEVTQLALNLLPDSRVLWRLSIALTDGDAEVVERAYAERPDDPEIWLAMLVSRARSSSDSAAFSRWAMREMKRVSRKKLFSAGTIVRAGDFLLRQKAFGAASVAAKYAVENARGLLPAYVLGLRCAVAEGNLEWAVSCADRASKVAIDPYPFLVFVGDTSELATGDYDAERVLRKLVSEEPREGKWARKLARLYLGKNAPQNAFGVLQATVKYEKSAIDLRTIVLSADAARLAGDVEKAVEILETVHKMYPRDRVVLNNLVYCLSLRQKTIARAEKLLPRLMELSGDSLAAFDTAASVSYRAGDIPSARKYLTRMTELVEKTNPRWLRDNPRAAEFGTGEGLGKDLTGLRDELIRKLEERTRL